MTLIEFFILVLNSLMSSAATLWLVTWKERREAKVRFHHRLICVANESKYNISYVGNASYPLKKALEKLVHDEPEIHHHPELFQKTANCLNTFLIVSNCNLPFLQPKNPRALMYDLLDYLFTVYGLKKQRYLKDDLQASKWNNRTDPGLRPGL